VIASSKEVISVAKELDFSINKLKTFNLLVEHPLDVRLSRSHEPVQVLIVALVPVPSHEVGSQYLLTSWKNLLVGEPLVQDK